MSREIFKNVKVSELPPELTEGLDASPDEVVRVTVDADYLRRVDELFELVHRISEQAKRNGLTEEKLAEILNEE